MHEYYACVPDEVIPAPDLATVRLSARQLRTLAHPLRARLLSSLRLDGPATATALATALGTNSGATSYHLRQLAAAGLVVEDAEAGRGRERWWRAAHQVSAFQPGDYADDPDAAAAADWFEDHALSSLTEQFADWTANRNRFPAPWRDAASVNDFALHLSPARLQELTAEIWELLLRYRNEADPDEPDAEQVVVGYLAFPRLPR